jgi:hypothetical protein
MENQRNLLLLRFVTFSLKKKQKFKVSLTALFRESKVRPKKIREKSKKYKNSQNAIEIIKSQNYFQKKCLVMRISGKMHYL